MKKHFKNTSSFKFWITILFTLIIIIPKQVIGQKKTSTGEIDELDNHISDPFAKDILTHRAYQKSLFKDQQAIGGNIIKEGKAVGTSATVDEKSVTINIGLPMIQNCFSIQPTFKGSSSEGFVKVFDSKGYGKSLGGGANFLIFLNYFNRSKYKEEERISLHRKLRQLRYSNEGILIFPNETFNTPISPKQWHNATTPTNPLTWNSSIQNKLSNFKQKRDAFYGELNKLNKINGISGEVRYFKNDLDKSETAHSPLKNAYIDYLQAYDAIKELIPKFWEINNKSEEDQFISDSLDIAGSGHTIWLNSTLARYDEEIRKTSLAKYDTIQLKSNWVARNRFWINFNLTYNQAKQPIFNFSKVTEAFKEDRYDEYFTLDLAINFLKVRKKSKYYLSIGPTLNNMRVFEKDSLRTYQTISTDTINSQVINKVVQSEIYPNMPEKIIYGGWQAQASTYLSNKIGVDLTYKATYPLDNSEAKNHYVATFGIFVPIQASESTLLLMPQLKWDTAESKKPWTIGFNLSASIPGFVTKSNK